MMGHPIKHFLTITHHRHLVMYYCFKVGIGFQGLFHDWSKYSFTEFYNGAKYYTGTASPNDQERKIKGIRQHGCIIKVGISIILSIGLMSSEQITVRL